MSIATREETFFLKKKKRGRGKCRSGREGAVKGTKSIKKGRDKGAQSIHAGVPASFCSRNTAAGPELARGGRA